MLATGGDDKNIKIYDRRESRIIKASDEIHSGKQYQAVCDTSSFFLYQLFSYFYNLKNLEWINCVRWNASGDLVASVSSDGSVAMWEFSTAKLIYTESNLDKSNVFSKFNCI